MRLRMRIAHARLERASLTFAKNSRSSKTEMCDTFERPEFAVGIRPRIRPEIPRISDQGLLRKEVIQPQVPLRLPCYDFIPITNHTFGACLPCGLARRLRVQTAFMM